MTLLVEGEYIFSPKFSPDGAYITFNNSSDLFFYDLKAGKPALAYPNARALYWDALGRLVALSAADGIVVVTPGGGSFVYISGPTGGVITHIVRPANAGGLAYASQRYDAGRVRHLGVSIVSSKLGDGLLPYMLPTRLGADIWTSSPIPLAFSSDGTMLIINYKPLQREDKRNLLYFYNMATGAFRTLRTRPFGLSGDYATAVVAGDYAYIPVLDKTGDVSETIMLINLKTMAYKLLPTNAGGVDSMSAADETMVCYSSGGSIYLYRADTNRTLLICAGSYAGPGGDDGDAAHIGGTGIYFDLPALFGDGIVFALGISDGAGGIYTARTTTQGAERIEGVTVKPPDIPYGIDWGDMFDIRADGVR